MSTSRQQSHSIALAVLLWFACPLPCQQSFSQDRLPPVRQLIAETLALCGTGEQRKEHSGALHAIAEAQCYLGQFAEARKNLLHYGPQNFFRQAEHINCARIEIEITGSTASIHNDLWKSDVGSLGFVHSDAALAFLERGETDRALEHIAQLPKSVHSAFNVAGPKFIDKLSKGGHKEAARKVLLAWAACYENADSVFDYRQSSHPELLVSLLVEYDLRETATALCQHWRSVAEAETDVDECGEYIARAWAQCGKALAIIGDKPAAKEALHQARLWLEKARELKLDPEMRVTIHHFAEAYAAIGARQAVVLGGEESIAAYNQAYELARLSVNPDYGEYTYEQIVGEQLIAGHVEGAHETVKRLLTPRYRARCYEKICDHALKQNDKPAARAAALSAAKELDREGFEPFMAHDIARIATLVANAGESEASQRLFRRALALSDSNESPKFDHSWIAGRLISAGFLLDAYRTIALIPEPDQRTLNLAHLCREMARAEYLTSKTPPRAP